MLERASLVRLARVEALRSVVTTIARFLFCFATLPALGATNASPRLPRDRLLLFHDGAGNVRDVRSVADWQQRRAEIVRGFQQIAGVLPGEERRCPLDVRVEEETDCGEYVRRRLTYQSEPGSRVPAYLLIPKPALAGSNAFGVLCLHQTHAAGQKVVVGLGESPDDAYAVELARRGYVCLAPPYPLLANYQPDLKALGWASGTLKAVWDNQRALDLLEAFPFVQRGRFAAIGHSLGGHNAIFTAVFDERIKVVITSCAFDSFLDYMDGNITGWTQERYLPRLEGYKKRVSEIPFDFHELVAALAPRALFASAPRGDTNFKWRSVDAIAAAARLVFQLYEEPERLRIEHPDCGHRFPPELRQMAYQFIDTQLGVR